MLSSYTPELDAALTSSETGKSCFIIMIIIIIINVLLLFYCYVIDRDTLERDFYSRLPFQKYSRFDGSNPFGTMKICSRQR